MEAFAIGTLQGAEYSKIQGFEDVGGVWRRINKMNDVDKCLLYIADSFMTIAAINKKELLVGRVGGVGQGYESVL